MDNEQIEEAQIEINLKTVDDLNLPRSSSAALKNGTFSQYVEPTRDSEPWCDWEQAEDMLVQAAFGWTRGQMGLKPKGYALERDDSKMILTLKLTG